MPEFSIHVTADETGIGRSDICTAMLESLQGAHPNDHPIFLSGYEVLCEAGARGARILEICGGGGTQAAALARVCPLATIIGLDLYIPTTPVSVEAAKTLSNLEYVAGNAFDLSSYPENSFDVVFGQAALHHLSHDLRGLSRQISRILKPGGKLVFIFEPMGHNWLVAAIRAVRMARHEFGDESNLYLSQFRFFNEDFTHCEVRVFNLFGYFTKGFPRRLKWITKMCHWFDHMLFQRSERCRRWAANANLIFTKSTT
ncbi:MAG: methyltransferase domain-containing protein [Verrucomicrobiales bacterium]